MNHINKYIRLLDIIKSAGNCGIALKEIKEQWLREYGAELSTRTFHHQRAAIADMFGAEVVCNRSTNNYYIDDVESLSGNGVSSWVLDTFSLSSTLSAENLALRERILMNEIPSSRGFLTTMIDAMRQNRSVAMRYCPFHLSEPHDHEINPYFVKVRADRWYVYGVEANGKSNKLKVYALDRVESASITEKSFEMPSDFSAEDTLYSAFGVAIYDDITPQTITIRAYGDNHKYIDTLPLHHSQRKIESNDEYCTYELYVAPTFEFYNEMMKQNDFLVVTSPQNVREELLKRINAARERYSKP